MPHAQDICLTIFLAALVMVLENGLPGLQMLTGGATPQIHLRILGNDPLPCFFVNPLTTQWILEVPSAAPYLPHSLTRAILKTTKTITGAGPKRPDQVVPLPLTHP